MNQIKNLFDISAEVPTVFDGIPVLNNMSATFYYFVDDREPKDIDNLWSLFKFAITLADTNAAESDFIDAFNTVVAQRGVSWNITMGLYWIRPQTFINLDARNRKLLENNQGRFKPELDTVKLLKKMVTAENYLLIMAKVKEVMTEYKSFPELSFDAWKISNEDSEAFYGEKNEYWPSLAEYDPRLTKEDWKKYLLEVEIPNHPSPMKMLKGIIELGGEASCKQLAKKFGGHTSTYVGCTMNLGRKCDYETIQENGNVYKGKMIFAGQIKHNYAHKERCYVEYDEFNTNRAENKILKSTLNYLYKNTISSRNKTDIKTLLNAFSEVEESKDYKSDFDKIVPDRKSIITEIRMGSNE